MTHCAIGSHDRGQSCRTYISANESSYILIGSSWELYRASVNTFCQLCHANLDRSNYCETRLELVQKLAAALCKYHEIPNVGSSNTAKISTLLDHLFKRLWTNAPLADRSIFSASCWRGSANSTVCFADRSPLHWTLNRSNTMVKYVQRTCVAANIVLVTTSKTPCY